MVCPSLSAALLWLLGALLVAVLTANRGRLRLRVVWGLVGIVGGVGLLLSSTEPGVPRQPQVSVRWAGLLLPTRICGQALFYLFHLRSCAASAVGSNVATNRCGRTVEESVCGLGCGEVLRGCFGYCRLFVLFTISESIGAYNCEEGGSFGLWYGLCLHGHGCRELGLG